MTLPTDEQIAELFASGYGVDYITERGVYGGWSRFDALRVASARGWRLDKSGRVPLRDRPTVPAKKAAHEFRPGLVLEEPQPPRPRAGRVRPVPPPALPRVLEAVAQWAEQPDEPEPPAAVDPAAEEARVQELTDKLTDVGALTEPAAPPAADLLARGLEHPSPRIRKLAVRAQAAVDELVTALLRRSA